MNHPRYRHTQTGWAIIGAMMAGGAISLSIVAAIGPGTLPLVFVTAILSVMAMFSTLTVVVDDIHLTLRFTFGLIRKRIALADIRHYSTVRNPWYYGWGIHLYPGGVLYNVSGFHAVEILLKSGARLRIGTDEPGPVCRAIAGEIGAPEPRSPQEQAQVRSSTKKWLVATAGIFILVLGGIGLLVYLEEQPPEVTITDAAFKVEGVVYGEKFAMTEITEISLCQRVPKILARTNGYGGGRTLRGHFRLAELGDGQLFVRLGAPPYLLVRRRADYVIVNFRDSSRTREVYGKLLESWRGAPEACPQEF
jgi:hypothetical protein